MEDAMSKKIALLGTFFLVAVCAAATRSVRLMTFDNIAAGTLPNGWVAGVTGPGAPSWAVMPVKDAFSQPNVLAQTGEGKYPFCVDGSSSLKNGFVEVRFMPVSGKEDQAGGVVWRFKDKDNYYIARANALEDNVTIYRTVEGKRIAFKSVDMKVAGGAWHSLKVEFTGNHFVVIFDGRKALDAADAAFSGSGAVGVWTKADSVTYFDDFKYGP
jgi:hypothetical protein